LDDTRDLLGCRLLDTRVVCNDVDAHLDALVTDEHGRPRDQLANVILRLIAEGAGQLFVAGPRFAPAAPLSEHPCS
jgi:hypothetical protein